MVNTEETLHGALDTNETVQTYSVFEDNQIKKLETMQRPKTYFYLIRHAQCQINLEEIIGGRTNDSPLTPKGRLQAELLGRYFENEDLSFDKVYCSPALRCFDTMKISIPKRRLKNVSLDYRFLELSQGDWTGKSKREVYSRGQLEIINQNPWDFKAPGGESQAEVAQRIECALVDIANTYQGTHLIFTHGGAIKYFLAKTQNWNKNNAWKVQIENTSISLITYSKDDEYEKRKWYLSKLNETYHLIE
jgi:broad specificity phosphatase PhoE